MNKTESSDSIKHLSKTSIRSHHCDRAVSAVDYKESPRIPRAKGNIIWKNYIYVGLRDRPDAFIVAKLSEKVEEHGKRIDAKKHKFYNSNTIKERKNMENYINNIVEHVQELMAKDTTIETSGQALAVLVGRVAARRYVPSRSKSDEAEKFVRNALKDDYDYGYDYGLREFAYKLDSDFIVDAIVYNEWRDLDATLYNMVCVEEKYEIARRVKAGKLEHGELH